MNQIISTQLKQANPKYQLHTCKPSECLNLFAMSMELDLVKLGIELAKPPCDGPKRPPVRCCDARRRRSVYGTDRHSIDCCNTVLFIKV